MADEKVNIEHLLVEAMHNNIALPEDPLPSAEEIAGAKAAVAAAHSTYSAAAVPSQPVKGLGGAGLGLKRKGAGKAGNSSTISAATAPPALLGGPAGGKAATGAPRAAGAASNLGSRAAPRPSAAPTAAGGSAAAAAVAAGGFDAASDEPSATGLVTPEGPRQLSKDSSGVRSFRTTVSPDTADGDSSDWESASVDEVRRLHQGGRLVGLRGLADRVVTHRGWCQQACAPKLSGL